MPLHIQDFTTSPSPDAVRLQGLLGVRFEGSRLNRLHHQEPEHLLWPFQEGCPVGVYPDHPVKPGIRADWQAEYLGTWLDAALLTAWNMHDEALKAKIDNMLAAWLKTQLPDGYLGSYAEADRWKSWDVWVQAHDIIGLYRYYLLTGKPDILQAAVRIADRLLQDFGPGKRYLHETGPHAGMASSAILEPLMWLYQATGEARYLDFGIWLVDEDWEAPGGAQIISALLSGKGVADCGNSKGAEMLIDFTGLLELYRCTGERRYLKTVELAWQDIVAHHLYITGSASTGEYFPKNFLLPNEGVYMIGETCVSMCWMYLNLSLGRLTGDGRYFDMAEQTLYNHLLAAQSPDGRNWAYYVGLRDSKRYRWHTDPECCPTRGVRAIAHLPFHALTLTSDGVMLNIYEPLEADLSLPEGKMLHLRVETGYPFNGGVDLILRPSVETNFSLKMRLPGWCDRYTVELNGQVVDLSPDRQGYLELERCWNPGDTLHLDFSMPLRLVVDSLGNRNHLAVTRGPLVYAVDQADLPPGVLLDDLLLALDKSDPLKSLRMDADPSTQRPRLFTRCLLQYPEQTADLWREKERYFTLAGTQTGRSFMEIELTPFFEAGNRDPRNFRPGIQPNDERVSHISYQVWLPYIIV